MTAPFNAGDKVRTKNSPESIPLTVDECSNKFDVKQFKLPWMYGTPDDYYVRFKEIGMPPIRADLLELAK